VILVDTNLLLYAEDTLSEFHERARVWWDEQLSGSATVGLSWSVIAAFIRITTNARIQQRPLAMKEAIERVQSWLDQPCVRIIHPTDHHWEIFQAMLRDGKAVGNLVPDAHLAALAIEHNCVLYTSDSDFTRFRGLKSSNPIA